MPPRRSSLLTASLLAATRLAGAQPASPAPAAPAPDRVFVHATVWTGVPGAPRAGAIAVRGDRIVAVGSDRAIRALAGPGTVTTDLGGRLVVPGFDDAHWHFPARETAELADAGSTAALERRLRAFAAEHPGNGWLLGNGWGFADFPGHVPHRRWLDALFPDRPVALWDRDGHTMFVNSRALALAHVGRESVAPAAGAIDRDPDGTPTGVLRESAQALVAPLIPPVSDEEAYAALGRVLRRAAALGLTAVQVASVDPDTSVEHRAYRRALREGTLPVRLRVAVPLVANPGDSLVRRVVALRDSFPGPLLRFGILKGMLDGTIDARTAAMFAPYVDPRTGAPGTDGPGNGAGLPRWSQDSLDRAVARWDAAGLQVELHAVGDRAIHMALDAYAHAAAANGTSGRRHRVEHAELPLPEDLPRFRQLGVIASTQAMFATPDSTTLGNFAVLLGPERASRADAFVRFDEAGAVQAFGSDYPVFTMDPLRGIYTASTRMTVAGTPAGGWYPANRIPVEAALAHFTRDAAYAAFAEREMGTLEAGKLADFVVLSGDILRLPPGRIGRVRVLRTVMGGRERWVAPAGGR